MPHAVTVATLVTGHTSVSRGLAYIVAQTAGCALAAGMHVSDGIYNNMLGMDGQPACCATL
jgi:glycerol uptake facilitator-like aquaporin